MNGSLELTLSAPFCTTTTLRALGHNFFEKRLLAFAPYGEQVLIGGNVGGKPVSMKTDQNVTDDYLATVVVELFNSAGGEEYHAVRIEYSVQI